MKLESKNNYSKTICILLFLVYSSLYFPLFSQIDALPNDELIVVKLHIDGKPKSYITASWDEEGYFMRLFEVLDALQFKYSAQWKDHVFTGYITPDKWFKISQDTIFLNSGETLLHQKNAQWSSSNDLYINSNFLKQFFQIDTRLNLNNLSIFITTENSLPYKQNKERIRKLSLIKKQKDDNILSNVDTFPRSNIKINSLSYTFSQNKSFGKFQDYNFNIQPGLRGELLKGTFSMRYNYGSDNRTNKINDNIKFNWEKLDIKSRLVKSILVNHDYPTLYTSTLGYASSITISNTSKQANLDIAYNYIGKTLPNSNVEIYNNGQIVDYATSDSLGNFKVSVPNVGPDDNIKALTYNSLGIPITDVKLVYVPYGAIQKGQFIYKLTTGITDYGDFFFTPTIEYGLFSWLTLLAGNETVINWGDKFNSRPKNSISTAIIGAKISYNKWGNIDFKYLPTQLFHIRYNGNFFGIRTNINYEHRNENQTISNSMIKDMLQFNIGGNLPKFIPGNYILGLNYYNYNRNLGEMQSSYLSINMWHKKFTGNFTINTTSNSFCFKNPVLSASVGYYFKKNWYDEIITEYYTGSNNSFRIGNRLNFQFKNKLTAFINASYQFNGTQKYINVGVNWRLPYIQLSAGSYSSSQNTNIYTQASGSMLFHGGKVGFSDIASTSAALRVSLFVDVNNNGIKDKKEPLVKNTNMTLNVSCVKTHMSDGILFTDIMPNNPFRLNIPPQRLGDISWQINEYCANFMLYPYQCRSLLIPIKVLTEISGQVNCISKRENYCVKNLAIIITNTQTGKQVMLTTDNWGNYIFMGLTCGKYLIDIDSQSLSKLKLKKKDSDKVYRLNIEPALEGKQLDGFDFNLIPQ